MNTTSTRPSTTDVPPGGISLGDIYYILFRHKWLILGIFVLGLAGATSFYMFKPAVYKSEAKILIRYVNEAPATAAIPGTAAALQARAADPQGESVINNQVQMMTSLDMLKDVAKLIGPEKILGAHHSNEDVDAAASRIRGGLLVETTKGSCVVHLTYSSYDGSTVQPILAQVVESYKNFSTKLLTDKGHQDEFLARQKDQSGYNLTKAEDRLKELKLQANLLSLEDNRRVFSEKKASCELRLQTAREELAIKKTVLDEWIKSRSGTVAPTAPVVEEGVPKEVSDHYRRVSAELETYEKQLTELRKRYLDGHPKVASLLKDVANAQADKTQLEQENPKLTHIVTALAPAPGKAEVDMSAEFRRLRELEVTVQELTKVQTEIQDQFKKLVELEPEITKVEREKAAEASRFQAISSSLDNNQLAETSGSGVNGLMDLQRASPPYRDVKGDMKPMAMMLGFALFGGFALAFIIEKLLSQKLKRVVDLERLIRAPVFVTVPDLGWSGNRKMQKLLGNTRAMLNDAPKASAEANGQASAPVNGHVNGHAESSGEVAPWDARHVLRSYYEGLRDRLITYFEVRNLTHKPKLVAVTSCKHGAGVTTMAAGLAATLSETGDGNVLLVDMNLEQGAAHQFYQGKPGCALSEALESATREPAQVQENLYLVTAHETKNDKLPRVLPKRFAHLIPRMKASDYDYIIFDMPPISQTSVTPRLAGFMDMVLVVVESEATGQETLRRAHALLNESRATVATVLNKHRSYIPETFSQGL